MSDSPRCLAVPAPTCLEPCRSGFPPRAAVLTVRGAAPMFRRAEEPEKIFEVFRGYVGGGGRGEFVLGGDFQSKNGPMVTANGGGLTARDADPGAKTNSIPMVR